MVSMLRIRAFHRSPAWTILAAGSLAVGCGEAPTEPIGGGSEPTSLAAHSERRCRAVQGTIVDDVIAGDLVGVVVVDAIGPAPHPGRQTGPVLHGAGVWTLEITGGAVEWLVGETVVAEWKSQIGILRPPIVDVRIAIALSDGATGQLTLHGTFDLIAEVLSVGYRGNVCPPRGLAA